MPFDPVAANKAMLENPDMLPSAMQQNQTPTYVPPPQKSVTFTVGGQDIEVQELHWDTLEDFVLPIMEQIGGSDEDREKLAQLREREVKIKLEQIANPSEALTQELEQNQLAQLKLLPRWYTGRSADIKILAAAIKSQEHYPELTYEIIRKRLTLAEARQVSENMVKLLEISGFAINQGESEAVVDSTATSIDSSPNSSAVESPTLQTGNPQNEQ